MLLSCMLILSLLGAAAGWTLCIDPDQCYSTYYPFSGTPGRPFSIIPIPVYVRWFLYSKDHQNQSQEMFLNDTSGFSSDTFNFTKKTYFIIHGYGQSVAEPWINDICQELLKFEDVNCVALDWSSVSLTLYAQAANLARYVGRHLASVLKILEEVHNYPASNVHLIGHSIGAHIAGYAGKSHKNIDRITGLNPSGPYFEGEDEVVRLSRNDANFVDIIHTNGNNMINFGSGLNQPIGDVDFYPNGGQTMPECPDVSSIRNPYLCILNTIIGPLSCTESTLAFIDSCEELVKNLTLTVDELVDKFHLVFCSHYQATQYYIKSISDSKKYVAYPCDPLENCLQGISEPCPEDGCQSMGHHAKPPSSTEPQKFTLTTI